ncbi:MAG: tRNA uridine-5-carboxymethylaminomethyl(34) synthesis GTPase MnmE [Phreatobacter sp.]|nr:tRNA uridine-5-carboxymethylaminomethyl(34) synthesis GTPase MnmE [Phreatobacter sp.]
MDSRTIAAISTAPGTAGVAVIRVSGARARDVATALAGRVPSPRRAILALIRDPATGGYIDRGIILWFPGPSSFTGEDVLELQVHGGRAVVAAVLRAVLSVEGVRLAEAGEFTRRAFENGRMDLAEIEGLADLLLAETEAQRRQAFALYSGRLTGEADRLQHAILPVLAMIEASIDFPDEGDVASATLAEARSRLAEVRKDIRTLVEDAARAERVRDGVTVVIAGPPNAGKSTLLNALARRDVAIVSPTPGTTRDSIEVHLDLAGVPVVLVDTAGLRESADPVEQEGMRRAEARIASADLTLWLSREQDEVPAGTGGPAAAADMGTWRIQTQIDRGRPADERARHRLSAVSGEGMAAFLADLAAYAADRIGGEPALVVHERHRAIFAEALSALEGALGMPHWEASAELVAECLRAALASLGRSRGRIGSEAMLDQLFSTFCIGK